MRGIPKKTGVNQALLFVIPSGARDLAHHPTIPKNGISDEAMRRRQVFPFGVIFDIFRDPSPRKLSGFRMTSNRSS
jgi:hypothetical protein